jgi:hypothetical protein
VLLVLWATGEASMNGATVALFVQAVQTVILLVTAVIVW